jgi:hypothetical protein
MVSVVLNKHIKHLKTNALHSNPFDLQNAEVDQENDVHGSCDQHNSEIESTPAEAEALLHVSC